VERPTKATNSSRRGFTLAESLIASVVLAASVIGIAGTLSSSYQQSAVRGNQSTALLLAQQLMEEISSKPIEITSGANTVGWSGANTNRATYDSVDDYNGYTDVSGSIATTSGSTYDLGDGGSYTRTATVTNNALPSGLTGTATDFVLVTVTVQMPHNQSVSVSQLLTKVTLFR
jgi:type II secretory pathway pseudopilin PulG